MTAVIVACMALTWCAAVVAAWLLGRATAAEKRALRTLADAQKVLARAERIQVEVREVIGA